MKCFVVKVFDPPLTVLAQCPPPSMGAGVVWCVCEKSRPGPRSGTPCSPWQRATLTVLLPTGAVYIDQYCNPLSDISLRDIQAQIHSIVELVCKTLRGVNSRHPSLTFRPGMELLDGWAGLQGLGWSAT